MSFAFTINIYGVVTQSLSPFFKHLEPGDSVELTRCINITFWRVFEIYRQQQPHIIQRTYIKKFVSEESCVQDLYEWKVKELIQVGVEKGCEKLSITCRKAREIDSIMLQNWTLFWWVVCVDT